MTTASHSPSVSESPGRRRFVDRGEFRQDLIASLLPGVCEYKLANLVEVQDAEIRSVAPDRVELRIGKRNRFRRRYDHHELPVVLTLTIDRRTPCPPSMTRVLAVIRPRVRASERVFERRCNMIFQEVNYCLMGGEFHRVDEPERGEHR